MTKTCLKWHGGKSYLADWIVSHFPDRDAYDIYCEPYFGGGSVLFAHDCDGKAERVNDLNGRLMNFWRHLQDQKKFEFFKRALEATPFSEEEFKGTWLGLEYSDPMVQAVAFFIRNRQSRQGLMKDFATPTSRLRRGMDENVSAWLSAVDGLPEFHARLRRVAIYNEDAIRFIKKHDSPRTLFYLDPPYLHETRTAKDAYRHEMTGDQHAELLTWLAGIRGKFVLSGYPSELYEHHRKAHGWRCVTREIDNKSSGKRSKDKKTECLWMNYESKASNP